MRARVRGARTHAQRNCPASRAVLACVSTHERTHWRGGFFLLLQGAGWEGGRTVSPHAATLSITLKYVKTIGIVNNGYNGRGFANPYNVAVSRDGRIFVLNRCDPARAQASRM